MDDDTINKIERAQEMATTWSDKLLMPHGDVLVDLNCAIGPNACKPTNAPDQPPLFPKGCMYQFDKKYKGEAMFNELQADLQKTCPGVTWTSQRRGVKSKNKFSNILTWELRCQHYYLKPNKTKTDNSNDEKPDGKLKKLFTREGLTNVFIKKGSRNVNAFGRMKYAKLKSKKKKKQASNQKVQSDKYYALNRRTGGVKAEHPQFRCHAHYRICMILSTGYFYLLTSSCADHVYHHPEEPETAKMNATDLDEENMELLKILYNGGLPNRSIASIMTQVLKQDGQKGSFLTETVKNITESLQKDIDKARGIDPDFSVAKRTITALHRYAFFICVLYTYYLLNSHL